MIICEKVLKFLKRTYFSEKTGGKEGSKEGNKETREEKRKEEEKKEEGKECHCLFEMQI